MTMLAALAMRQAPAGAGTAAAQRRWRPARRSCVAARRPVPRHGHPPGLRQAWQGGAGSAICGGTCNALRGLAPQCVSPKCSPRVPGRCRKPSYAVAAGFVLRGRPDGKLSIGWNRITAYTRELG